MRAFETDQTHAFAPAEAALLAAAAGEEAALALLDADGAILAASPAFARLAGTPHLVGANFGTLFGTEASPRAASGPDLLVLPFALPLGGEATMVWSRRPDGGWTGVLSASGDRPQPLRRDPLTGLGDRAHLDAAFDRMMADRGDAPPPIVLAVDLDRFKEVNDTLGHDAGDSLLRLAADRMMRALREGDVLCRFGGDEFAVLLAGPRDIEAALGAAERLIEAVSRPYLISGAQALIGASAGLAEIDEAAAPGAAPLADALQRADIALYEAKRAGRGRAEWFRADMRMRLERARALEADLRRALLTEEFEVHYQPQHRLGDGALRGFEALLRWNHPDRGMLLPEDFLAVAERTGLIVRIGGWVLREACRAAAGWPAETTVAVNVSPAQFVEAGFVELVEDALAETGLHPERLDLELTENVLIEDEAIVSDRIDRLRSRGVRLSLDDFGSGYASLSYLRRFRFDTLKIDKSFILAEAEVDDDLVGAIVDMGAALGVEVMAEGVETDARLDFLRAAGAQSVQGYHFGRAMRLADAEAYLAGLRNPNA